MIRSISIVLIAVLLISSFFSPVLANGVDGTVAADSATVPDASAPAEVSLEDVNNSLGVIQSQLWIILVVGLLGYVYKFFRLFF